MVDAAPANPSDLVHVCVVGAGTMGRGITQVALQAGHRVSLVDPSQEQLDAALADIRKRLAKRHPQIASALPDHVTTARAVTDLEPNASTIVIEAASENLAIKHQVLTQGHEHFGADTILATNTSSLSITEIAAGTPAPQRVVGMHFFNPVPVMKLVEVVNGLETAPEVADIVTDLAQTWGKSVARVRSAPGFIVNRVARPFYGEALRLLEEGSASAAVIDEALRAAGSFRMGPFELMDLIGTDVNFTVTKTVWQAMNYDNRYAPSQIQNELVLAGRFGRKSGRGFHSYEGEDQPTPEALPVGPSPEGVIVHGRDDQLRAIIDRARVMTYGGRADGRGSIELPDGTQVVVTRGRTAADESSALGSPVVVIDRCLDPTTTDALAASSSNTESLEDAAALLGAAGIRTLATKDLPGLVVARVVSMLINEAWEAQHVGIASATDIDTAMKLGTNYPVGLFEWCDRWSAATVLGLLDTLNEQYRDPRYRASYALRAAAGA